MNHPFEVKGLGKSPFVLLRRDGLPEQAERCAFCDRPIKHLYWVRSADEKQFVVGSECISKGGLGGAVEELDKTQEAEDRRLVAEAVKSIASDLKLFPHPIPEHAASGRSLWDYIDFIKFVGGRKAFRNAADSVRELLRKKSAKPSGEKAWARPATVVRGPSLLVSQLLEQCDAMGQLASLRTGSRILIASDYGGEQLKQHAVQILGTSGSRHLAATDAWFAVYVDAPVDRLALRLRPEPVGVPEIAPLPQLNLIEKARAAIGFPPKHNPADIAGRRALNEMYRQFGPRAGEQAVIQVSSLPGVLGEAANLLTHHGTPLQTDEVEALLSTYAENDARIDDDPHIQCLCHLWLTATHAIKHRQPLWLVK
ncbi:MAG: hypothetical protein J0L78_10205 [Planctomycetes bacterium]|nr:hypothetical protein [Planctomycetota bacterium]